MSGSSLTGTDGSRTGSTNLASACAEFSESWQWGIGKLGEATESIGSFARETARTMDRVEDELKKELDKALKEGGQ